MAEPEVTGGQAATDSVGTTVNAPEGNAGSSVGAAQTTGNGSVATAIDSFFDPASITGKPELEAAYKQMQASYTKRMQDLAKHRSKIEAYDRFEKDPVGTLRAIAGQYGFQVVQQPQDTPQDWNPQSWDDVMAEAEKRVLKKMQPVLGELKELKKQNVEQHLDSRYPDWRTYEDQMMDLLKEHPSLVKDPDRLYRLAVPPEVIEARATKAAMQKLKTATDNAQVSGGSATTKAPPQQPDGPLSFDQAVQLAHKRLAAQGIKRPAN